MTLKEYSDTRALRLLRFPFENSPEGNWPRVLWFGFLKSENKTLGIYSGHHKHSFFEAHFIFEGEISYQFSEKILVKEGEGLLIPPKENHRFADANNEVLKLSFAFELEETSPVITGLLKKGIAPFKITEEMKENVNAILKHSENDNEFSEKVVMNRLNELYYNLLISLNLPLPKSENFKKTSDIRFVTAVRFIENNLPSNPSLEEIAAECSVSTRQLNRIFQKQAGKSLSQYINGEKIKAAEELLLKTKLSIAEISRNLGFESDYYFRKFFRRHTGMPPAFFRKTNS